MTAMAKTPQNESLLKQPPFSLEAEQSVLGGLMLVSEAIDTVTDKVCEADFYRQDHRMIWRAIVELTNRGQPTDPVTLGDWFHSHGLDDMVGGTAYIVELANNTPSAANIGAYADIVHEKSVLRQLIDASSQIASDSFNTEGRSCEDIVSAAEERIFRIAENGARGGRAFVPMTTAAREAFQLISGRFENKGGLTGTGTGFTDLDRLTCGLQPSDLIILAGRPSMGKTAMAMNLAEFAAVNEKRTVAVFSMEMTAAQLTLRLISGIGKVEAQRLRTGELEEEDWPRISNAIASLTTANILIDDTPSLSPTELRSRARRLYRERGGLGLIVIDYLQLMVVPGSKENRATEIAEISRSLKALAKELNVPVVALSQLNRAVEQRNDKRPLMSDLRESGSIEQDADVIMFLYRDDYYNKDSPDKGLAEVIIGKQRMGPTDTVKLVFNNKVTRFDNYTRDDYQPFD